MNLNKHEEFATNIKNKIAEDENKKASLLKEAKKIQDLVSYLNNINEMKQINLKADIGGGVYYDFNVDYNNSIIINIGCDVYLEYEYRQAIILLKQKESILLQKIKMREDQIIKNRAYYNLSCSLLDNLKLSL